MGMPERGTKGGRKEIDCMNRDDSRVRILNPHK